MRTAPPETTTEVFQEISADGPFLIRIEGRLIFPTPDRERNLVIVTNLPEELNHDLFSLSQFSFACGSLASPSAAGQGPFRIQQRGAGYSSRSEALMSDRSLASSASLGGRSVSGPLP